MENEAFASCGDAFVLCEYRDASFLPGVQGKSKNLSWVQTPSRRLLCSRETLYGAAPDGGRSQRVGSEGRAVGSNPSAPDKLGDGGPLALTIDNVR